MYYLLLEYDSQKAQAKHLRQRGAAVCYMLCFISRVMRKFLFPERASTM